MIVKSFANLFWQIITVIGFFTIIPITPKASIKLYQAAHFFSFVGAIIGILLSVLIIIFLSSFSQSNLILSGLIVIFSTILTGAIHFDGLADSFDAVFLDKSKRVLVLHDPSIGVFGTLALIFSIIIMVFGYYQQMINNHIIDVIFIVILIEAISLNQALYPPIFCKQLKKSKLANYAEKPSLKSCLISISFVYLYSLLFLGIKLTLICLLIELTVALFGKYFLIRRFGGYNGDQIGALIILSKLLQLLIYPLFF